MARTSLSCPLSQRPRSTRRMPAAIDSTTGAERRRGAARAHRAASRICCGLTASTTSSRAGDRLARALAEERDAGELRREPAARVGNGSTTRKSAAAAPRASMPPMSAVAMLPPPMKASSAMLTRSTASRAPKIAVPTRTSVAPSAMASSRSADMPIDSVSTGEAGIAARIEALAQHAELRPAHVDLRRRLGDAHDPAQAQPGQRRDRRRRVRTASAGATPLFGRFAAGVDLDADVERRRSGGTRRREPHRDLRPIDGLHPGERRRGGAALLLCNGPIRCHRMSARSARAPPSSRRPPARSFRRIRAGPARGPPAPPRPGRSC